MSQHIIKTVTKTGTNVDLLIGFDRPLQSFFATVFELSSNKEIANDDPDFDDEPFTIYDNLATIEDILKEKFGIIIPNAVSEDIESESFLKQRYEAYIGYKRVKYNSAGDILEHYFPCPVCGGDTVKEDNIWICAGPGICTWTTPLS